MIDVGINKGSWEMCTLSKEDINEASQNFDVPLEGVELDEVARRFKEALAALIGDNWDECLAECIREVRKDAGRSCKTCDRDEECAGNQFKLKGENDGLCPRERPVVKRYD